MSVQVEEIKTLEDLKKNYIRAKLVYEEKIKALSSVMEPYDKLYEEHKLTDDEMFEIELKVEEEIGIDEAFEELKKAEEELIDFAKPLLLRFAKTEEERKGLEMVFNCPYVTIREQVVDAILRWFPDL
jgi:hypothetical protein